MTKQAFMFLLLSISISSCANNPLSSYSSNMELPINVIATGNINQAESSLVQQDNLLYYLEHGTVQRMSDKYTPSNTDFTKAQAYIDAWVNSFHNGTLGLATDTIQASMINDQTVDYSAKDYEKVMLPTYKALNYIALGDVNSARVEITRMYNIENVIEDYRDQLYVEAQADMDAKPSPSAKRFATLDQVESMNSNKYNFSTLNSPQVLALKNSYQNAFSHYLAGFIFEALQEPSLARPGYIKAGELNPDNPLISQSITNLDKAEIANNNLTDLLLIQEVGHAPGLKSVSFPIPFQNPSGQNTCTNSITISFPELVPDKTNYGKISVRIDDKTQDTVLFTDFNLMVARYLHDNLPNVFLRDILRAGRDIALQQASCNGGGVVNLITLLGTYFLDRADERTWLMLPGQIYVSRVRIKKGMHTINVSTAQGSQQIKVNLKNNYAVLSWRVIGSGIYFSPEQSMLKK